VLIFVSRYSCGEDDVNEVRDNNIAKTDIYWSMYYISPERQLKNQFTIPFKPPISSGLTLGGTSTGFKDFNEYVAQQQNGEKRPICIGRSSATRDYIRRAFRDVKLFETEYSNDAFYQGMMDGNCSDL